MKNSIKIAMLSLLLVGAPLCAVTQNDTEVTTKVTKKTPHKKETRKTVTKTKAAAHKPTTTVTTAKTETVKKAPTTQTRVQKLHAQARQSKPATKIEQTEKTRSYTAPVTAAPLLAGAALAETGSLRAQASHKAFKDNSVVYALEQHPQVSTFTARLKQHHELAKLSGKGEYTIFAPLNEALVGKHLTDAKLEEHIVPGNFDTAALRSNKGALKTLSRGTITIQEKDGHLYANNAEIVGHGIKTKNGQIHFVKDIVTQ